ncbi:hypothetical protein [Bradyrhizobium sp. BR 1432]|uniref:hypothetical protein n=1 Tax=Bradyrhizobium sp. BR 1432 TaxID=3447966 RepID=UPI003EE7A343
MGSWNSVPVRTPLFADQNEMFSHFSPRDFSQAANILLSRLTLSLHDCATRSLQGLFLDIARVGGAIGEGTRGVTKMGITIGQAFLKAMTRLKRGDFIE